MEFSTAENYFKISEVARLTNVTRQTLIFYDKKDLVKPAFVDTNQYRYYTVAQIHLIQIINMLKEFDVPLKTIKFYLHNKDKDQLMDLLNSVQQDMVTRIERTKNYLQIIDQKKALLQKSMEDLSEDQVIFEDRPAIEVLTSERLTVADQGEGHFQKAHDFEKKLHQVGLIGLGLNTIVEQDFVTRDYQNHISYFCVPLSSPRRDLKTRMIPAGTYAVTYHHGKFQSANKAYVRLIDTISSSGYVIDGDSYETIISNFLTEDDDADYRLEIAVKVKKSD